jgi:GT2 family glycosyltransferase
MKYFVAVNYGTSALLPAWFDNIKTVFNNPVIYVVDNYHSETSRLKAREVCRSNEICLIESDNIGYGRALNLAFNKIREDHFITDQDVVFAGNLDITFTKFPDSVAPGQFVYMLRAMEGNRNRNPFLTTTQLYISLLQKYALKKNSILIQTLISKLTLAAKVIPSKNWAIHGSLFVFNGSLLKLNENPFNEESFLYCEELEFASFANRNRFEILKVNGGYNHTAHVATSKLAFDKANLNPYWTQSYKNWLKRWNY